MPSPDSFLAEDNWRSFFYELAIEIGPVDDARLQEVLTAVWAAAGIEGCFGRVDREPEDQTPVPCTVASLTEFGDLTGRVRLPDGQLVVCGCLTIREENDGSDWLVFYLPGGALSNAGLIRHFSGGEDVAQFVIDWLADVGLRVFERAPFALGLVGGSVSGMDYAADLNGEPPERRRFGYLLPQGDDIRYFPSNV